MRLDSDSAMHRIWPVALRPKGLENSNRHIDVTDDRVAGTVVTGCSFTSQFSRSKRQLCTYLRWHMTDAVAALSSIGRDAHSFDFGVLSGQAESQD